MGSDVGWYSSATRRVRGVFTRAVCHLQNRFGFSRSSIHFQTARPSPSAPDWLLGSLKSRCNCQDARVPSRRFARGFLSTRSLGTHAHGGFLLLPSPTFRSGEQRRHSNLNSIQDTAPTGASPRRSTPISQARVSYNPVRAPTVCGISVRKAAERFVAGVRECRI